LFYFDVGEQVVVFQPWNYKFYSKFIGLSRHQIALFIFLVNVVIATIIAVIQRKRNFGVTYIAFSTLWLFMMFFGYDFGFYKARIFDFADAWGL